MTKKKVLFVAHMDSHIANFHLPYLKWFKDNGYETHVASNSLEKTREFKYVDVKHQIDFGRSPFSFKNIKVYKEFKKLINNHDYSLVHTHTPIASIISRLALRKKKDVPVIYTAHGFHFLKGGSKLSWFLFYPVEKYLSKYTDTLITINNEDYNLSKNKFNKKCSYKLINGVGVSLNDYTETSLEEQKLLKNELSLNEDDFILTYVGEQTKGKNQKFLINLMTEILKINPNTKLLLVGYGKELENHQKLINKLKLNDSVKLLGYRTDINNILSITDLFTSSSLREGLPKSLLEAMASNKALLVSNARGNRDLVKEGYNGYIFNNNDNIDYLNKFKMLNYTKVLKSFGTNSYELVKDYDINLVLDDVVKIYKGYL